MAVLIQVNASARTQRPSFSWSLPRQLPPIKAFRRLPAFLCMPACLSHRQKKVGFAFPRIAAAAAGGSISLLAGVVDVAGFYHGVIRF